MSLADARGKMLYEILPHVFPEGYLTDLELALWGLFYEERDRKRQQSRRR